ncbi:MULTISPECIES: SURF1 family protein [unclassified Allobranchiibius]|uniref:SURF1 family protein n=1 Tax=unclassified Allobranchiibius TaxID=2649857 RepID=UPI001AA1297A|nr:MULTISPECIES: SURF1 family protein [unclassified Allobranchiibius]MBO1768486.1 SURF1 family protein [Allobranchiibius sp. GilTou38]UIJ34789.1 SURF1 family protein [Allobranchiibius sp. GilTou73]
MLRAALTPRLMGLFVLMVVLVVAFVLLGIWQLDVARSAGHATANHQMQDRPVTAITSVMQPAESFPSNGSLRPVRATGHYDGALQELVAGRTLDGHNGFWVLTPLVVDGNGARLPVVRGFVADPTHVPAPLTGSRQVTVTGALAPGESPATGSYPSGQIGAINLAVLANTWGGTVYNAFVFATDESPSATAAPVATFPPPQPGGGGFHLLNAGYAVQWWAFSCFAVYVWVRMVRDEYAAEEAGRAAELPSGPVADNGEGTDGEQTAAASVETKDRQ